MVRLLAERPRPLEELRLALARADEEDEVDEDRIHVGMPQAGRGTTIRGTPEQPELPREVWDQIVRSQEQRWLSEPVPALGGRTPIEAAADPEARRELDALLDDFEWADQHSSAPRTMDVSRLRRELGLTASRAPRRT